jgi:beta-mannosidase
MTSNAINDGQRDGLFEVIYDGTKSFSKRIQLLGDTMESIDFDVESPTLWYPRGFGEPNLHSIEVKYNGHSIKKNFGFRTVELVQDPIAQET